MAYSDDDDLIQLRSNILSLGNSDWSEKHDLAKKIIDQSLSGKWYRSVSLENGVDYQKIPFDSTRLLNAKIQLKDLSCYKTLELIYMDLTKDTPEEDGFGRHMSLFAKKYDVEFASVIRYGLDYDWDNSGEIGLSELPQTRNRRLKKV